MRTIPVALQTHYEQDVTTVASCVKVTLADETVLGFTNHLSDIVVDGVTYVARTGYDATDIETGDNLSVDNLEIHGILDSPAITEEDLLAGRWDRAMVELFDVNYEDIGAGIDKYRIGWLGEVKVDRARFIAELNGLAQAWQQEILRVSAIPCDAVLGDTRCKKDLTDYTTTGTVGTVFSSRHFYTDLDTKTVRLTPTTTGNPDDTYFDRGLLTWTSGDNIGRQMEIKTFLNAEGELYLQLPMASAVSPGDTFIAIAGCLHRLIEDCKAKFGNVVNYRGDPYKPTPEQLLKGPAR